MTIFPSVIQTTIIPSSIITTIPFIKTTLIQSYKKISTIPSSLINKSKSTFPSIKTSIIQSHKISTIPSSLINKIKSTISNISKTTVIIPTSTFSKNMISTN